MSKDIRVLIIKLSDRLHNLQTINYMNNDQIKDKCKETLEIYAPLAGRLGMFSLKFELEDISLKQLDPDVYNDLRTKVNTKKEEREQFINKVINEIKKSLDDQKIQYEITGRSKHFYSIYKKMTYQNKQLDEIFDLSAVRVIVDSVRDCYAVLGAVHTMWKPIPGRFKDYIAMPKPNLYQSLHTTVLMDSGDPLEIQIRSHSMHRIAEYGIAAHWKYKEGVDAEHEEVKLAWLRQTLEWQKDMNDPKEFMETLKVDLFSNQVFVFTPKGDVMELPAGSTPLDFAFKIHSGVGNKCTGAKVNGKIVPLEHELTNGEIVEIITSSSSKGPSIDWLKIAKTSSARNKIRQWLKKEQRPEQVERGKTSLEKAVRRKGYEPQALIRPNSINKIYKNLGYTSVEEMYTNLCQGSTILSKAVKALISIYDEEAQLAAKKAEREKEKAAIAIRKQIEGRGKSRVDVTVKSGYVDNLLIRLARCCNPVRGDSIVGYTSKGKGVVVHRTDCPNMLSIQYEEREKGRFIEVEWLNLDDGASYEMDMTIVAEDRKGLFSDISKICEDMDIRITGVNAKSASDGVVNILISLSISNVNEMEKLLRSLKNVRSVSEVHRRTS
jgi:GTP pyrophosphokinase